MAAILVRERVRRRPLRASSKADEPLDDPVDGEITRILRRVEDGEPQALDQLLAAVVDELHATARALMQHQAPGHSLQATALVNEAYLRLFPDNGCGFSDRKHFFRVASRAMRCVLVDAARAKKRIKRQAGKRLPLEDHLAAYEVGGVDMLALHEALTKLAEQEPRLESVVELKYFGGRSDEEVAEILGVSERTVERDWKAARAWLSRELK